MPSGNKKRKEQPGAGKPKKAKKSAAAVTNAPHDNAAADIDDIFADVAENKAKKRRAEAASSSQDEKKYAEEMQQAQAAFSGRSFTQDARYGDLSKEVGKDYDFVRGHEPKPVRFDSGAGLPVYKEAALGVSLPGSGTTKDCPFDCDCCF